MNEYQWKSVTERAAFTPRDGAGALVFDGKMWLLGGWNPYMPEVYPMLTNSEVFQSIDGKNWILIAEAPWERRHAAGYAVYDNKMWIMAGNAHTKNINDVWFSTDGESWSKLKGVPWPGRHAASVFVYDDALWLAAGYLWNDVWKLERITTATG